jgi:hypothetical protein
MESSLGAAGNVVRPPRCPQLEMAASSEPRQSRPAERFVLPNQTAKKGTSNRQNFLFFPKTILRAMNSIKRSARPQFI